MYRETSPQSSFLEPHYLFPDILPEDDWSYIYREKVLPIIDEEKFRHLYQEKGGAPNKSIKLKISLLIFMGMETLHWREVEFMFRRRIDWMNATHTALGEAFIDHTTLFKFFSQLEKNNAAFELFKEITETFVRECKVSIKTQRTDSFFMHGWLAILSRYGLFKETIRTFLQALRKHKSELYEKIKKDLSREYLKENFDLTEKDKAKASRKVRDMAKDLLKLKEAFQNDETVKGYQSFKILVQVFEQQCEIKEKTKSNQDNNCSKKVSKSEKVTEPKDSKIEETNLESMAQESAKSEPEQAVPEPKNSTIEETNLEPVPQESAKSEPEPKNSTIEETKLEPAEQGPTKIEKNSQPTIDQEDSSKKDVNPESPEESNQEGNQPEAHSISQSIEDSNEQGVKESTLEVCIREKLNGDKIISSPHNTDSEYTRKRKQTVVGHKCFVTETCDRENDVQFITDVNLKGARHSDAKELSPIQERLVKNQFKPEEHFNDAGFVNGETILESEERGIALEGPSSGRSQSFEEYNDKDRPLDVADFKVEFDDLKALTVIECPQKQVPTDQSRREKTGKIIAHFSADVCRTCPVANRCPIKIGKRVSSLYIEEKQYRGALRHHQYMSDPEYRKRCGTRAGAESMVNEFVNGHGARQSRHKTEEGSKLQLIFAAIGVNVKRFIKHTQNCVQKTVITTD